MIAVFESSLANRICTVPFAEGVMIPSMIAMFAVSVDVLLHDEGTFTAPAKFNVCEVADRVYRLVYRSKVAAGALIVQRLPQVVAALV